MATLKPQDYQTMGMDDLVDATWARVRRHEAAHYDVLLETMESGTTPALERRLDELERRRAAQLRRLMPADAHDEDVPKPDEQAPDEQAPESERETDAT